LRTLILGHRGGALLLIAVALALKALIPAGYMVGSRSLVLSIEICADTTGEHLTRLLVLPRDNPAPASDAGKGSAACPFASLWVGGLAGDVANFVAAAIAFILVLGFAPMRPPRLLPAPFMRPPLRAPPGLA
jgi:hypothetical protein